jgi:hypothetical protein
MYASCHCGNYASVKITVIYCPLEETEWTGDITFLSRKTEWEFAWMKNKVMRMGDSEELHYTLRHDDNKSLFEQGKLTFNCKIETKSCFMKDSDDPGVITMSQIEDTAQFDLDSSNMKLEISEQFSDVNINPKKPDHSTDVILWIKHHEMFDDYDAIHVHKRVLSMKSRYFERMFESGMKETHEKNITLENVNLPTMKKLLNFMYNEMIPYEEITTELLIASDYYDVPHLREVCIARFTRKMNVGNVIDIWSISEDYNIEDLAHNAIIFMAHHWKEMICDGTIQTVENFVELNNTISCLLSDI